MKRNMMIAVLAMMAIGGMAQASHTGVTMRTDIDSMSYTIGMSQSQGLREYLTSRLNVNLDYESDFLRGLQDGVNANSQKDQAYYAGTQIGQQIVNQMLAGINKELFGDDARQSVSQDLFMKGFISGFTGRDGVMSVEEAQKTAQRLMDAVKTEKMMAEFGANKTAGEQFLAENAKKAGVQVLPSGVQYKVLTQGTGAVPTKTQKVKVHYSGTTVDGTEFDSSYKRGEPATFRCDQVIQGWTDALTHMPVGSTWEVYIPQELAYGNRQQGNDIKPFSALIFKIELLGIEP